MPEPPEPAANPPKKKPSPCPHGLKHKRTCPQCNPSLRCPHGKYKKSQCVTCTPSLKCPHGKNNRRNCAKCVPSLKCTFHNNNNRYNCKQCKREKEECASVLLSIQRDARGGGGAGAT